MLNINSQLTNKIYHDLLVRITNSMLNTTCKADFFGKVLKYTGEITKASRVYLFDRASDGFWSNTFEWCAEGVIPYIGMLQNVDETHGTYQYFFRHINKGGSHIYDDISLMPQELYSFLYGQGILSLFAVPLYENNRVTGFFGFDMCEHPIKWEPEVIDIFIAMGNLFSSAMGHFRMKEQLENQSRDFEQVLNFFPDPIFIVDKDTHEILFANENFQDTFLVEDIKAHPCYKLVQRADEPCTFCTHERLLKENVPITWTYYNEFLKREFRVKDCCVEWQGRKQAHLSTLQDITEFLDAKRCEVIAHEANIAKNTFLANMSHEFRTPLNGIAGLSLLAKEYCKAQYDDPVLQDYHTKIQASTVALGALVNNILDFVNLDPDEFTHDSVSYSIQTVIQNILVTFEPLLKEKGLTMFCRLDETLPQLVVGNVSHLTQIIMNIVSNAVKFTAKGSISLECCVLEKTDEHLVVIISIKDTGIGLKEDEYKNLFQIFSQVDSSYTRDYGGVGMGLAISNRLIKSMGGSIHVESVPDEGSTFSLRLPFTLPSSSEQIHGLLTAMTKSLHGSHILVVEDNEINQMITEEILVQAGSVVHIANNGEQALEMLEKAQYDLILMDIQMPIMDGITATKRIRQTYSCAQLPIIALTAHSQGKDKEQSAEAGMQEHLTKPIDTEKLMSILYKWLNIDTA